MFFVAPKSSAPRHLKKAWLQRHTGEDFEDTTGVTGGGSCVKLPLTLSPSPVNTIETTTTTIVSTTINPIQSSSSSSSSTSSTSSVHSLHTIGSMAVNSINKAKTTGEFLLLFFFL